MRTGCRALTYLLVVVAAFSIGPVAPSPANAQCAGAFTLPLVSGIEPEDVRAVGDVNLDGLADVVTARRVLGQGGFVYRLTFFVADGVGGFSNAAEATVTLQAGPTAMVVADLDQDGVVDVAMVSLTSPIGPRVTILRATSLGTFLPPQLSAFIDYPASLIEAADLDHDGDLDLVIGGNARMSVLVNDGSPGFQLRPSLVTSFNGEQSLLIRDQDGDGNLDLIGFYGYGEVAIVIGNGDATFRPPTVHALGTGFFLFSGTGAVADFNGDGRLDYAHTGTIAGQSIAVLAVRLGRSDGTLNPATIVTLANPVTLGGAADLNGDADADMVYTAGNGLIGLARGRGDGTFDVDPPNQVGGCFSLVGVHPVLSTGPGVLALGSFECGCSQRVLVFGSASVKPAFAVNPPSGVALAAGDSLVLHVAAVAGAEPALQWRRNGIPLSDTGGVSGAQTETLHVSQVSPVDSGVYDVVAYNPCSGQQTASSQCAVVVSEGMPCGGQAPQVVQQPVGRVSGEGDNAAFEVAAVGSGQLTFQWRIDGVPLVDGPAIHGSGTAHLELSALPLLPEPILVDCLITNTCGLAKSRSVALAVVPRCDPDLNRDGIADQGDVDALINVIAGGSCP